ncbi:MAG: hypothetical protein RLZZ251_67 [Actinomycetota bacterium]|jgi:DNA-binding response OmpR family regulator
MATPHQTLTIALYSDDASVRRSVSSALGRRLSPDLHEHTIHEFATADALKLYVDAKKKVDLFILDGEATPEGGMGLSKELKDQVFHCPPILLIVAREQDAWLAGWSRADGVVSHPIDPFTLAKRAAALLSAAPKNL